MTFSNRRIKVQKCFIGLYALITAFTLFLAISRQDLFNLVVFFVWVGLTLLQIHTLKSMYRANESRKKFDTWFEENIHKEHPE